MLYVCALPLSESGEGFTMHLDGPFGLLVQCMKHHMMFRTEW